MRTTRREFLELAGRTAAITSVGGAASSILGRLAFGAVAQKEALLVVARGKGPIQNTEAAVDALGGLGAFMRKGAKVVIKPNIGWTTSPQQAGCTNPDVVATLVRLARQAGAGSVTVVDRPCSPARAAYKVSGIEAAARKAGAKVVQAESYYFKKTPIPRGQMLKEWPLYGPALDADLLVNVPVAKDHDRARLTMCMKNLLGVMGGNRGTVHVGLEQKIVDLNTAVVPQLNVLDATRVMVSNGPRGLSLDDVVSEDAVIASASAATVDAWARDNLPFKLGADKSVGHIDLAIEQGMADLAATTVKSV